MADDRGGSPEDLGNFVTLMRRLRDRLNRTGRPFGISITLVSSLSWLEIPLIAPQPASYWYLKGFDIVELEAYVDWFNIMTYDIRQSSPPHAGYQ